MNNELYHHGIKGMKWGVRRFQNKDGSLTPKGRQRYDTDYKEQLRKVENADKVIKDAKKMREGNREASAKSYERKIRKDVSQMTDKELQQAVNRLNMEERYTQVMTNRQRLEAGESRVDQILNVAGGVLAGAATALSIAAAIKELQK